MKKVNIKLFARVVSVKVNLLAAGIVLAALGTGLGQSTLQFGASTYAVAENAGFATLTVQRTGDTNAPVSVDYTTADGTATNGLKYTVVSGTLAFGAGETNRTIVVPILNNGFVEGAKNFRIILSNAVGGGVLGTRTNVQVTIKDNDVGVDFQFASYTVVEDAGQVLVGVVRGDDGTLPVTVDLSVFDETATNGIDYALASSMVSFAPQERLKPILIGIINNSLKEPKRTFRLELSNPRGGTLGSTKTARITIADNDQGFQFESAAYTVVEDCGAVLIHVLRGTDETNSTVAVDCFTTDQSATNGLDYTGLVKKLSFAPGESVKRLPIPILNNGLVQPVRSFRLTLANPSAGTALGPVKDTIVSILDNDAGVGFEQTRCTNAWGDASVRVTVLRGNDWALGPITVDYATTDQTAKAGQDYQAMSGTLEFKANETLKNITIPLLRMRAAEGTKMFRVTLNNATGGATLGTSNATVIILGTFYTLAPQFDTALSIRHEPGFNILHWIGGGALQKADTPNGPWWTLTGARDVTTVASPVPEAFYRVARPRPVNLCVPSGYDRLTPIPLVILLHGYYVNNYVEDYMKLRPLAESRGFLYCYPDGTIDAWGNRFWNATDASGDFGNVGVDDVGYLRSLIAEISRYFAVDKKRIHLVGHSQGGFMAYRMACESSDLIAAIASLAGGTFFDTSRCAPSERVNVLGIHGSADEIISYIGGANTPALNSAGANMPPFPGAVQSIQMWAGYNGCSEPVTDAAPSLDLTTDVAGLDTVVTRYNSASPGGAVELWTINGGAHMPTLSSQFSPRLIDWLLAHPKP